MLMEQLKSAEKYIAEVPVIQQASSWLNVRPLVIPVISIGLAMLIFGQFEELILTMAGFFYPAWQSYKAIEGGQPAAGRQWLAYWVVYASFSVVELFSDVLLFWVPFYYLLKLSFILWLAMPQYNGATVIYDRFLQPFLATYQTEIDGFLQGLRRMGTPEAGRRRGAAI